MIEKGKSYSKPGLSIVVFIEEIWHECDEYYMAKITIHHRRLPIWYEVKDFKLYKNKIKDWVECKADYQG